MRHRGACGAHPALRMGTAVVRAVPGSCHPLRVRSLRRNHRDLRRAHEGTLRPAVRRAMRPAPPGMRTAIWARRCSVSCGGILVRYVTCIAANAALESAVEPCRHRKRNDRQSSCLSSPDPWGAPVSATGIGSFESRPPTAKAPLHLVVEWKCLPLPPGSWTRVGVGALAGAGRSSSYTVRLRAQEAGILQGCAMPHWCLRRERGALERWTVGGQAASSACMENYLGSRRGSAAPSCSSVRACRRSSSGSSFSREGLRAQSYRQTNVPSVFVAGDVRHGSVKRCASAVGKGPMAVAFVHRHLSNC
jgi:hypothetical protein